ncbi:unnamed protein product [marine sediment metagenome]|uniref:DUF551 domain-containing protein n=1 Tax=marine sediment metagenome TaxID=412755 RepID=X0VL21_9ZZZZ
MDWISVKDKLPEDCKNVLCYIKDIECKFYGEGYYYESIKHWYLRKTRTNGNYEVTHWMPLPEPPKEKSGK